MQDLISCLPKRVRQCVAYYEAQGYAVEEIRLHREEKILLVCGGENILTGLTCSDGEFEQAFLALCEGSLYAHTDTLLRGYLSVRGGYRVGVSAQAVGDESALRGIGQITGLNLRLPRDVVGAATPLYERLRAGGFSQSALVFSAPGVGKTTLLRDLARQLATPPRLQRVCVVDSRRELGFGGLTQGTSMELLSGYPKAQGMEIALRTLAPQYLLCDEIGNEEDVAAILHSLHAGVRVVAAAHGDNLQKLLLRDSFSQLHQKRAFDLYCHIAQNGTERRLEITEWEALS